MAVTPDGLRAVSGSRDGIRLWDLESGQESARSKALQKSSVSWRRRP